MSCPQEAFGVDTDSGDRPQKPAMFALHLLLEETLGPREQFPAGQIQSESDGQPGSGSQQAPESMDL